MLWVAVAFVVTSLIFFKMGEPIVIILDHFFLSEMKEVQINSFSMSGEYENQKLHFNYQESFFLSEERMISTRGVADLKSIDVDSTGLVTIKVDKELFILGRAKEWVGDIVGWQNFSPDPGDKISLHYRHGIIPWFGIYDAAYFPTSEWRRNTYHVFKWVKQNGRELRIEGKGNPQTTHEHGGSAFWGPFPMFELAGGEMRIIDTTSTLQ